LSAFAPHHLAPKDLIETSREFSPEEIRVQYLMLKAQGQEEAYRQEEARLANAVAQQCQEILNNVNAAVSYIVKGRNEHPNRWDVINDCNKSGICPDWVVSKEASNPAPNPTFEQSMQQAPQANFIPTSGFTQNAAFNQPTQSGFSDQTPAFSQPAGYAQQPTFNPQPQQQSMFGNTAPSGVFGVQQQPNDGFDPVSTSQPSNFAGFHNPKSTSVSMSSPFATTAMSRAQIDGQPKITTNHFATPTSVNVGGPVQPPASGQRYAMSSKSQLQHVLGGKQPSAIPDTQAPDSVYGSDTAELEKIYQQVREKGEFPGGVIPEVAPKIEWVGWDWYGV
jgi:nucleoporin NUP42